MAPNHFLDRFIGRLQERGVSQRLAESKAGYPTGTLSKLKKGTLRLQGRHVRDFCQALELTDDERDELLDDDTLILLSDDPEAHLRRLHQEKVDDLSQQVKGLQGQLDAAAESLKAARDEARKQRHEILQQYDADTSRLQQELDRATSAEQRLRAELAHQGQLLVYYRNEILKLQAAVKTFQDRVPTPLVALFAAAGGAAAAIALGQRDDDEHDEEES
jgi:hypothetical protein